MTKRIDYVLKCKESGYLFGVEVKRDDHLTGTKLGEYLKQASDYSNKDFNTVFLPSPVKIPIFITPAISNKICEIKPESEIEIDKKKYFELYHSHNSKHSNVNSLIGCFNVGEIKSVDNGRQRYYYFVFKNFIVWESRYEKIRLYNYNKMLEIITKAI